MPFQPKPGGDKPHHFHNSIPVFYETASQQPHNAFLLPFIADPPTTTLQRLKGLTTGTLPTFIDAGSNFAGTAIDEDNLVTQLRNASKTLVHLGDDTWHSLFPGCFEPNLTRAYDSFNVWDLHTVDNGVTEHLFPLLHPDNSGTWDVIFGHYLGVDHAGHRYGPDHSAMTAKLQQMDDVFRKVIELIDNDTLLVVMGDHGMDAKGDHGGESDDEIESALWMYSKNGFFGRAEPSQIEPPATGKERAIAQIDLVPTLALLLGIPIPFNNLGAPIKEAFIGRQGDDYKNLAIVNRVAAAQIHRYQQEYAIARGLSDVAPYPPLKMWDAVESSWNEVTRENYPTRNHWREVCLAFEVYQRHTLSICRDLWARFDLVSMVTGIVVLVGALVVLIIYARGIEGDRTELTPALLVRGVTGTVCGAAASGLLGLVVPALPLVRSAVVCTAIGSAAGIASALLYVRTRLVPPLPRSVWAWACIVPTVLLSIGFASNSFTIWEDEILLYFLAAFGIIMFASSFRQEDVANRALGCYQSVLFTILTRLASLSRLCREEQMPYCKSTYYASATSSTSASWQLAIPFVLALLLPDIVKSYYKGTRSYQGSAILWLGFAFRIGLLLSAVFWILDAADDGDWFTVSKNTLKTTKVIIAQIVLGVALAAGYSTFAWAAPLLSIETQSKPRASSADKTKSGSQLGVSEGGGSGSSITILGYANVHGSRYALLITMWALAITLVQKPMGGGAIGILLWQIFSLLEIVDTNSLGDTPVGPVVLGLLGSFHFFKTGHQATLSSIQWESAFVPLREIRYPWSPLLVVLNAFGAQILCAVAVPATVLWKQPPKKKGLLGGVAKATATHLLFYAVINLATTMWAGWLRRHLMLYRIFSPRFMTGAVVLLVVDVAGTLIAIGGTRWSFLSVAEVFGWM